jgi:hypothetical protein
MNSRFVRVLALAIAGMVTIGAASAHAFRLIQNTMVGRTSSGFAVACSDAGGFAHWNSSSISWRLNTANQGAGKAAALQNAMASWNAVSPASYTLSYDGTGSGSFATDGTNTVLWASGNGCTGSCLAITALVLAAGQVITETDVSFNNAVTWNTDGSDYDTQAIATHELGHTLGVHHTEINKPRNRPTMYAYYFGTAGRTLEDDDKGALNCIYNRYPPTLATMTAGGPPELAQVAEAAEPALRLSSRPRPGGAIVRFALQAPGQVRLEVFDVAGRKVVTLVDEFKAAGEHEIAWDGASSYGRAASGFYFARMSTAGGRVTTTVPLAE